MKAHSKLLEKKGKRGEVNTSCCPFPLLSSTGLIMKAGRQEGKTGDRDQPQRKKKKRLGYNFFNLR